VLEVINAFSLACVSLRNNGVSITGTNLHDYKWKILDISSS
jgi:hypothetical protein